VHKFVAGPLIKINSNPIMRGKWLFDTGAGHTCLSTKQFRLIPIEKRPTKLNLNQKDASGVSGIALIPDDNNLFPIK
jgi:hypothetical protein